MTWSKAEAVEAGRKGGLASGESRAGEFSRKLNKRFELSRMVREGELLKEIDADLYLSQLSGTGIVDWLKEIASRRGVKLSEVFSRDRMAHVSDARGEMMLVMREQLGWSYPALGKFWGRDHTTVMSVTRKAAASRAAKFK